MSPSQVVSISGLIGSGTTTVAGLLHQHLGWTYVNSGQLFRQMAVAAGVSLAEFGRRAQQDDHIDRALDARTVEVAKSQAPVLLEGRMTGWMLYLNQVAAFKVWLAAPVEVRAERVRQREGTALAATIEAMSAREASERQRYQGYYQADLDDLSIYDLVVDTQLHAADAIAASIALQLGGGADDIRK